jgi:hypothetical protein
MDPQGGIYLLAGVALFGLGGNRSGIPLGHDLAHGVAANGTEMRSSQAIERHNSMYLRTRASRR